MWRHIASNALTLLIVALIVAGAALAWGRAQYTSKGPLERAVCLRVEKNSNMTRVSEDLAQKGAISSPVILRIGANYEKKSRQLKAGSFLVPEGASMAQIVDIVTRGGASTCGTEIVFRIGVNQVRTQVRETDPASRKMVEVVQFDPLKDAQPERYAEVRAQSDTRYRVTMAEGTTVWQVVEAMKAADFLKGKVEKLPPEGMLAPGSYELEGFGRTELLAHMQQAQEAILADAWAGRDADLPLKTPMQALTLASIVEKETGVAQERPTVSSVFVNRLRRGMKLQTDPAVIYGVTNGRGSLGRGLRQSELRKRTPYNTYVVEGLPPTPIANPGKDAILAAVHPARTDYLFFVANGTGGHAFAATLAEHNKNVAAWRALEAQKSGN